MIMTLEFWKKEDFLLAKKIEHFSKSMTQKRMEDFLRKRRNKNRQRALEEELSKSKERVEYNYKGKNTPKEYLKAQKNEVKRRIKYVLSKHIIPVLLKEWFFDSYKINVKTSKKTWHEIRQRRQ